MEKDIPYRLKHVASSTQLSSSEIEGWWATCLWRGHRSPAGTEGASHPQGCTVAGARGTVTEGPAG